MITCDLKAFDKFTKHLNTTISVALEVQNKLKNLPYKGALQYARILSQTIDITFEEDVPLEYSCGIASEIETLLGIEEFKLSIMGDVKWVKYLGTYKGISLELYFTPKNSCVWIDVEEKVEINKYIHRTLKCV